MKPTVRMGRMLCLCFAFFFVFAAGACGAAPVTVSLTGAGGGDLVLTEGETVALTASASDGSSVRWESSDESIATVADGVVAAVGEGACTVSASCAGARATCRVRVYPRPGAALPDRDAYRLVWNDEFEGDALDETRWSFQLGTRDVYRGVQNNTNYWGNNEAQYYTRDAAAVADGLLTVTARRETAGDRSFTSARITTRDLAVWTYGYFEARMRLPAVAGMWPAFWMLPQPTSPDTTNVYGGWAANGEIDIMEAKGREQNIVGGTLHFGGGWPDQRYKGESTELSSSIAAWHTYAVEWTAERMTWYADGEPYFSMTNGEWYSTAAPDNSAAPFDQPFYLLLNLAVGGNYDNGVLPPDDFQSAEMAVDYVRVYARS